MSTNYAMPKSKLHSVQATTKIGDREHIHTWCKDLSASLLFLLADDVTLLRLLKTTKVSSLSANSYRN